MISVGAPGRLSKRVSRSAIHSSVGKCLQQQHAAQQVLHKSTVHLAATMVLTISHYPATTDICKMENLAERHGPGLAFCLQDTSHLYHA